MSRNVRIALVALTILLFGIAAYNYSARTRSPDAETSGPFHDHGRDHDHDHGHDH